MQRPYIGKWISSLYRSSQAYYNKCFEADKIGNRHYSYLLYLYRQEGVTQDAMSRHFNVDKATVARNILSLEALGYVRREVDPEDKRAYRVYLTEAGRKLEPKIRTELKNWAKIVTATLSESDQALAYQLLQTMAENALAAKERNFE